MHIKFGPELGIVVIANTRVGEQDHLLGKDNNCLGHKHLASELNRSTTTKNSLKLFHSQQTQNSHRIRRIHWALRILRK